MSLGFILGALSVTVVSTCIAFACNELSLKEKRRQERMRDEYIAYEDRKRREYQDTCEYFERMREDARNGYQEELAAYRKEMLQKRKEENDEAYRQMQTLWNEQHMEKDKLLAACREIVISCKNSVLTQQNSYVRFKSIKATLISLQEAEYKLEAYLRYMKRYKQRMDDRFETYGDLLEPFSMTLPEDWPYEGKVMLLRTTDFFQYSYDLGEAGRIWLDKSDTALFDDSDGRLPFMVYRAKSDRMYLSLSKGLLKTSIGGTIGLDMEVVKIYPHEISLRFANYDYLRIRLSKRDLIRQNRKTPIGSNLHVFVKDYDFALKERIAVSEKIGDGLSIAQFECVALVQTETENQELYSYLEKNNLLDETDEWRIGPILDEAHNLTGLVIQSGCNYAIRAFFENFMESHLVLRYAGLLSEKDFISFDDVFVATNVTLNCYARKRIEQNPESYIAYFEECQKLRLYLISEFAMQRKMMARSPMRVYLDQWEEVTNRLIDHLGYGGHIKILVTEWNSRSIQGIEKHTVLHVENQKELLEFVVREEKHRRYKFFVALLDGGSSVKRPCKINTDGEGGVWIRLNGWIDKEFLLAQGFILDLYSLAIPYAEKQQANAFCMFREGRVADEEVKAAIVNISEYRYSDSGYRISDFFNQCIRTNAAQMDAVTRAFSERHFFLIQGPPGTGKTTVIKELVLQCLRQNPAARIIVVSQANVAVDNVLRGIVEFSGQEDCVQSSQIVRCGVPDRIADDVESYSLDKKLTLYQQRLVTEMPQDSKVLALRKKWIQMIEEKGNEDLVGECLLSCFQIIGVTCVGLENRHYGLAGMEFDLAVIDEAGKALAGELLIPINRAKKVVIIGDHKQLPPVINPALYKGSGVNYGDVVEDGQQLDFVNRSFFQRLYEDCPQTSKCMLNVQFRMPPVIADLVNMFYDGSLETGKNCFQKRPMFLKNHLIFVDMKNVADYHEEQDTHGNGAKSGPYNEKELEAASTIVRRIREHYNRRIVVITPYKEQKRRLQKRFQQEKLQNVWVNTIDAFQGDEEDVVLYCTTRAKQTTQYFSDSTRLNVAFSRARNTLIFLASGDYLKRYPENHILRRVSGYLENHAAIVPYDQWLKADFSMDYDASFRNPDIPDADKETTAFLPVQTEFFDMMKSKELSAPNCVCAACGKALEENEYILCADCISKTESYKCKCCGNDMILSYYDQYFHGIEPEDICAACQDEHFEEADCSECGTKFYIQHERREVLVFEGEPLLCRSCEVKFQKPVRLGSCARCSKDIIISYGEKIRRKRDGDRLPIYCEDCEKISRELVCVGTCKECLEPIEITNSKKWWLEDHERPVPTLCGGCLQKLHERIQVGICGFCGKPIEVNRLQYEKHLQDSYDICKDCMNAEWCQETCKECGERFSITFGEMQKCEKRGWPLPRRCSHCRKQNHLL